MAGGKEIQSPLGSPGGDDSRTSITKSAGAQVPYKQWYRVHSALPSMVIGWILRCEPVDMEGGLHGSEDTLKHSLAPSGEEDSVPCPQVVFYFSK